MQKEIQKIVQIEESRKEITEELVREYQALLDLLLNERSQPLSVQEAEVLMKIFPKEANQELGYSLMQAIEAVECSRAQFNDLIASCPSQEWREKMLDQLSKSKFKADDK
ncbi:hypothetical protein CCZ01_04225 [Helicobacter monodelphidis]|uniref:hypothetical protein n=1 Tax=Helicobacter sp. 15-1451 TaxID=2004995 RepID=UPI000DCB3ADA|nr:hypothetical protein [Helicobacter sp. 15-1451]RAX58023.1 hypothetical protein CCZ01_04225 [Helicobacter sp. 15-1451]